MITDPAVAPWLPKWLPFTLKRMKCIHKNRFTCSCNSQIDPQWHLPRSSVTWAYMFIVISIVACQRPFFYFLDGCTPLQTIKLQCVCRKPWIFWSVLNRAFSLTDASVCHVAGHDIPIVFVGESRLCLIAGIEPNAKYSFLCSLRQRFRISIVRSSRLTLRFDVLF